MNSLYNWYRNTLRHPKYRWWLILGSLAYLFLPFDFLPDFIPVVGQIDDAVILTLLVAEVSQMLAARLKSRNEEVVAEAGAAGEGSTPNSDTVDVKAVPIK